MLAWLSAQPPTVATFLGTLIGTLIGSSFGLVTLLIGAFVNASLNRRRDDRLREEEARSIRIALTGELTGIQIAFNGLAEQFEKDTAPNPAFSDVLVPDLTKLVRVMPVLLPRFALLSPDVVRHVIDVYATVEQFGPTLILLGGKPHSNNLHTAMSLKHSARVAELARSVAKRIDGAISRLKT